MLSKVWAIFVRDARLAATYKLQFYLNWFGIAASVVALSFIAKIVNASRTFGPGVSYFDYALVNVAFLTLEIAAIDGCEKVVRNDQIFGTLPSILTTPTSISVLAVGSTAWSFAFALAQIACYLLIGTAFGLNVSAIHPVSLALFVLLAIAVSVPMGILSTAMVIVFKQGAPVQFLLRNAAAILAGVMFPVTLLPGWLQHISWLLPMTHILNGVRGAFTGNDGPRLAGDAIWLVIAASLLLPTALVTFRAAVARARHDGTLSHY